MMGGKEDDEDKKEAGRPDNAPLRDEHLGSPGVDEVEEEEAADIQQTIEINNTADEV
jgi:hypothetical protein